MNCPPKKEHRRLTWRSMANLCWWTTWTRSWRRRSALFWKPPTGCGWFHTGRRGRTKRCCSLDDMCWGCRTWPMRRGMVRWSEICWAVFILIFLGVGGVALCSSRLYLCTWKSSFALHRASQKFPQHCLWNSSSVCLTDDGPLVLSRKIYLVLPLSMPLSSRQSIVWCTWPCGCR